jgi:hypothetical protein
VTPLIKHTQTHSTIHTRNQAVHRLRAGKVNSIVSWARCSGRTGDTCAWFEIGCGMNNYPPSSWRRRIDAMNFEEINWQANSVDNLLHNNRVCGNQALWLS